MAALDRSRRPRPARSIAARAAVFLIVTTSARHRLAPDSLQADDLRRPCDGPASFTVRRPFRRPIRRRTRPAGSRHSKTSPRFNVPSWRATVATGHGSCQGASVDDPHHGRGGRLAAVELRASARCDMASSNSSMPWRFSRDIRHVLLLAHVSPPTLPAAAPSSVSCCLMRSGLASDLSIL